MAEQYRPDIETSRPDLVFDPAPFTYRRVEGVNFQRTTMCHIAGELVAAKCRNKFLGGAANSGKTVGIIGELARDCIKPLKEILKKYPDAPANKNRPWHVVMATASKDVSTQMRNEILKPTIDDLGGWEESRWVMKGQEGRMGYGFPNGSRFEFYSPQKAKDALGFRCNVIFNNEQNRQKEGIYLEQDNRIYNYQISDWNQHEPSILDTHGDQLSEWIAVYVGRRGNEEAPEGVVSNMAALKTKDPRRWRTFDRGDKGWMEGLIYKDRLIEIPYLPEGAQLIVRGCDLGYSEHAAVLSAWIKNGVVIIDEELYQNKLTTDRMAKRFHNMPGGGRVRVWADYHHKQQIEDLRRMGINIRATNPKIGIVDGIISALSYQGHICYTARSTRFKKEIGAYSWGSDDNGDPTGEPKKTKIKHACDALRYIFVNTRNWKPRDQILAEL